MKRTFKEKFLVLFLCGDKSIGGLIVSCAVLTALAFWIACIMAFVRFPELPFIGFVGGGAVIFYLVCHWASHR